MFRGYCYLFHELQPGKRDRITFFTEVKDPFNEIKNIYEKSGVHRLQLIWEGVEEYSLIRLPPLTQVPMKMIINVKDDFINFLYVNFEREASYFLAPQGALHVYFFTVCLRVSLGRFPQFHAYGGLS